MHKIWLIVKREYLQRVRTKAFILFTVLMPAFIFGIVVLPAKLMMMRSGGTRHIVIVASDTNMAEAVKARLNQHDEGKKSELEKAADDKQGALPTIEATINGDVSEQTDRELTDQVSAGKLDGYLWLSDDAIQQRKVSYTTKNTSDFLEKAAVQSAVRSALTRAQLEKKGLKAEEIANVLTPVEVETVALKQGQKKKSDDYAALMLPFLMMMMIYMALIIYGVGVMRSVIEEKTTRVVEVLLSSVTPQQLMTGKILGVGGAGFTQMLIWTASGAVLGTPAGLAVRQALHLELPVLALATLPLFFIFGYLFYSTLYAAMGAMCNSDEEAQQLQWPVLMPIIFCTVFAMSVIRDPNSQLAFWLSIFPMTSPLIMFARVCVSMPPAWQLGACFALLALAIWGVLWLAGRIYRVGILMYGKRPTLPEIIKWIRYA